MATTFLGWILTGPARAQDTHYWTEQYGARSMLLSGSVIGSVNDMSAVYYNPGALGYLKKPELVLSASAYQFRKLKVKDGGGRGVDLGSSHINLIPNLVAGTFRFNFQGPDKLAYSVLTRYQFNAELRASKVGEFDLDPDAPGDEFASGGLTNSIAVSEVWVGLTWARGFGKHVGVGVTTFFTARSQQGQDEFFLQSQTQTGEFALLYELDNYNARMYGFLWKAGLGLNLKPFTAGLTVTTPNVRVSGTGGATLNETWTGIDIDDDGIPDDGFNTDNSAYNPQSEVATTTYDIVHLAGGAKKHGLHLSRGADLLNSLELRKLQLNDLTMHTIWFSSAVPPGLNRRSTLQPNDRGY